jgi:hypothetical protein
LAYGGKPGFPLGSLPAANCTTAWTRMLDAYRPGSPWRTARPFYTGIGRLVADAGKRGWDEFTAEYGAQLMEGLAMMGCKRSGRG